ncbi:hypothetical protein GQ43DRAFT_240043 [Delitschia confertaspora ATCC 74209]|uniref:Uncharacterized protein n=1 Tax=Delitschia confertaspora ATCC 74209 TaxID=1513339 RepID=A0A9P4MY20_9PLEO|nr:hypothetical protein GQ43DRAFT_240043 [Delitschia confertaspora ATCC 74209]
MPTSPAFEPRLSDSPVYKAQTLQARATQPCSALSVITACHSNTPSTSSTYIYPLPLLAETTQPNPRLSSNHRPHSLLAFSPAPNPFVRPRPHNTNMCKTVTCVFACQHRSSSPTTVWCEKAQAINTVCATSRIFELSNSLYCPACRMAFGRARP